MTAMVVHRGGCHCGAVRFKARAPAAITVYDCNCSICSMSGFVHLVVAAEDFELLQGADALITYTFNTGVAKHPFCRTCGVKSYYMPRSHPNGFSVNVRCLDEGTVTAMETVPFDGRNWEEAIHGIVDRD